jgi:hypothetical protein
VSIYHPTGAAEHPSKNDDCISRGQIFAQSG